MAQCASPDDLFVIFRNKTKLFKQLITGIRNIENGFSSMNVRCLQISFANAMFGECFSKAKCYTEPQGTHFVIGALFRNGLAVLKGFIQNPQIVQEVDSTTKAALESLVQFFLDGGPTEDVFCSNQFHNELEWTVVVAQHILCKLSGKKCIIDHHYPNKDVLIPDGGIDYVCPCDQHEHMPGKFGDTSFGYEHGWHGSVDIQVGNTPVWMKSPTSSVGEDDRLSTISDCSDSFEEVEKASGFLEEDKMHLKSMCIVHSFLQRKHDETLNNYLIPAIGMSRKKLVVVFYDCVKDILLTTAELDLEDPERPGELSPSVIVLLWLTLNYKLFSSGVPTSKLQNKADFGEIVRDKLECYREEVKRGVSSVQKTEGSDDDWADVPGERCENEEEYM